MNNTIYLTYCSRRKNEIFKNSTLLASPKELYTSPRIQFFINYCEMKQLQWAIFSDLYGLVFADDKIPWYDKSPDSVSSDEYAILYNLVCSRLKPFDSVIFYYEENTMHPLYEKLITDLGGTIQIKLTKNILFQ